MINIRTLKKLNNNDGLTLKNGKIITYKTGWQVATEGVELSNIEEAMKAVRAYKGNCGIWLCDDIWYIDKSQRISTKKEAMLLGREYDQKSIFGWASQKLAWC